MFYLNKTYHPGFRHNSFMATDTIGHIHVYGCAKSFKTKKPLC